MSCECGDSSELSASVCVIVVFAPGLERPYPLIPAKRYRCCIHCQAFAALVTVAQDANSATAGAGAWTQAFIVFDNGEGLRLTQELRATQAKASA